MQKKSETIKEHLDWLRERATPINESRFCSQKGNCILSLNNKLWIESFSSRTVASNFKSLQLTTSKASEVRNVEECRCSTCLTACVLKRSDKIKNRLSKDEDAAVEESVWVNFKIATAAKVCQRAVQ